MIFKDLNEIALCFHILAKNIARDWENKKTMKKHKIKEGIRLVFTNLFELEIKKKDYTMDIHLKMVVIEKLLKVKIALKVPKILKWFYSIKI